MEHDGLARPRVVAEIGCNHRGEPETAAEMVRIAAGVCHVDVVKFQKRYPRESLSPEQYDAPHPVPRNSYGHTYGAHREALEFTVAEHQRLKALCEQWGVTYSASVWDMTSARDVAGLHPELIKVPSACNTHFDMLRYLCDEYGGQIHISLGMTTRREEEQIVELIGRHGRLQHTVLYACTSGYPVAFEDLSLLEITRLRARYHDTVAGIGYSGHHLGIAADIAALTLGAQWIERHFTLDRTWKGTDHAASLEAGALRSLVRDIRNVSKALTPKTAELLPVEIEQRQKLKWRSGTGA